MLIPTIKFEIPNNETGEAAGYLVENTIENQEKVFSHRLTRQIEFDQTFDFQYEKEMNMPVEFIDDIVWTRLMSETPELFIEFVVEGE